MTDTTWDTASKQFTRHLLPADLQAAYPKNMHTDYLISLHPDIYNIEHVTNKICQLTISWLQHHIKNQHLPFAQDMWLDDINANISYAQENLYRRVPEWILLQQIGRSLAGIYGMDTSQFNDDTVATVYSSLLYLTPPSAGHYLAAPATAAAPVPHSLDLQHSALMQNYATQVWAKTSQDLNLKYLG